MIYSPGVARHILTLMREGYAGGSIYKCYHAVRFPHGSKMCALQALYTCAGLDINMWPNTVDRSRATSLLDFTEEQMRKFLDEAIALCTQLEKDNERPR